MGIYEIKKPRRINSFSVTLTLILIVLGYLGWFIIPLWWPVFQETSIMQGICNDAYREYDNEKLMVKLMKQSARTGLPLRRDNFVFERVPYQEFEFPPGLGPDGHKLFETRGKECRLSFTYVTKGEWPLIGKKVQIPWKRSVKTDLKVVHY